MCIEPGSFCEIKTDVLVLHAVAATMNIACAWVTSSLIHAGPRVSPNPVGAGLGLVVGSVDGSCCTLPPSMGANHLSLHLASALKPRVKTQEKRGAQMNLWALVEGVAICSRPSLATGLANL
jgi:hypothetical protein